MTELGRAVLMPLPTIGLLGGGPEGAAALAAFGVNSSRWRDGMRALETRLSESSDERAAVEFLAAIGSTATGWISVTSPDSGLPPVLALVGPSGVLAGVLHGELVEWSRGNGSVLAQLVRVAAERRSDATFTLTASAGGADVASIRLSASSADLAAPAAATLSRLTDAAQGGLESLVNQLVLEIPAAEAAGA